jgi:hypothetical protein
VGKKRIERKHILVLQKKRRAHDRRELTLYTGGNDLSGCPGSEASPYKDIGIDNNAHRFTFNAEFPLLSSFATRGITTMSKSPIETALGFKKEGNFSNVGANQENFWDEGDKRGIKSVFS